MPLFYNVQNGREQNRIFNAVRPIASTGATAYNGVHGFAFGRSNGRGLNR